MRSDVELAYEGMTALIDRLGIVEAEKFIATVHRESFDYTEWRKRLWVDKSVREISSEAMSFRNAEKLE